MTNDSRYEQILNDKKEKVKNMCDVADRLEKKGRTEERKLVLKELVEEGLISIEDAANKASMTVEEFCKANKLNNPS